LSIDHERIMNASQSPPLGPALRRAWVGYQRRLDAALADAGFGDRAFPDGRVVRLCRDTETTIAQIGRELGITRQGAAKIVGSLRERRYVTLRASKADAREKIVTPTSRAIAFLDAQDKAVRALDRKLRAQLGDDVVTAAYALLDALGGDEQMRMRDYLRTMGVRDL
jgi:DNA-binding MarR family transcriptional regulator